MSDTCRLVSTWGVYLSKYSGCAVSARARADGEGGGAEGASATNFGMIDASQQILQLPAWSFEWLIDNWKRATSAPSRPQLLVPEVQA
ncbi:hypothetical protein DHEL01_v208070 [Diaporthe helianthi]|uniref:Uncharacterized protein n=1 Tax=Diaporthe helianthi TaxID=158607 RepID=A0A2P5HTF2_DIAHE|nr:hypothetical protein DHEL01_v208070 [Diaporthe helianthi]